MVGQSVWGVFPLVLAKRGAAFYIKLTAANCCHLLNASSAPGTYTTYARDDLTLKKSLLGNSYYPHINTAAAQKN